MIAQPMQFYFISCSFTAICFKINILNCLHKLMTEWYTSMIAQPQYVPSIIVKRIMGLSLPLRLVIFNLMMK
jgi:hypothetical protein